MWIQLGRNIGNDHIQRARALWDRVTSSSINPDTELGYLSQLLNGLLLIIIILGVLAEGMYPIPIFQRRFDFIDLVSSAGFLLLALAYLINRRGYFKNAVILTLSVLVLASYAIFWLGKGEEAVAGILIYLVLPILLAEFFLSKRAFVAMVLLTLAGMIGYIHLPGVADVFLFLMIISALIIFSKHLHGQLEQKRQWTLQETERKYRTLAEASQDLIMMVDRESRLAYCNEFCARQFGVSQHELLGKNMTELFPPASAERQRASLQRVFASGESFYIEAPVIFPGGMRWLGTRLSPIKEQDGELDSVLIVARDITERREAEQALEESEHRLRALIENSADAIALIDADGTIQFESPAAIRILGYEIDEMVGHRLSEFLHPDDIAIGTDLFAAALEAPGAVIRSNVRYRCKDKSFRWMAGAGTNLLNEASVRAIVLNYRDVTEHKQAEERIQRQLQRLSALRTIDLAISSTFDMKMSLTVVLSVAISQLGTDAAAVLIFNPAQSTLEYAAGQGFYHPSIQHTRFPLTEGCTGQAAGKHQMVGISNLSQAGGDFGRAELLQEEAFISYYAVPLIVKGELKGMLEVFHRKELRPDQEWLDFLEILAGQAAIAIDNAQLFEGLQRVKTELEHRVAERIAELNQINIELEHANHAKDEFLASMSHELRTPLNSILGMSETLLEERRGSLNAYQQRSVQHIESSGHHLLDLINDILDLSKIEAGKLDYYPQPVAVDEVCRSSLSFVKSQAARKSITIDYDNRSAFPEIVADVRRLKQILVNLLTNAVKFTPDGGHVTLQVRTQPEQDLIQFSVIDNGIGIAEKDLLRLFQPFTQVDSSLNRQYEGTGLGLALVQKLTDLHGGSVQVESEVGKGSRFTINLPCLSSQVKPAEVRNSQSLSAPLVEQPENMMIPPEVHKRGVILLAEDNMPNVLTIGEYLESYGYEIVVAHDGLEAITKAEHVNPDLILMDIQMPAMDGLEATRRLRANPRFVSTPIIALTALAMPGDRERCLHAGATEYMSKPVSLKVLVKTIKNLRKVT